MGLGYRLLRKVVRNDAMKVDPEEVYNFRTFMLAVAACWGGTLFGIDIGIIGGVITMKSFQKSFGYSSLSTEEAKLQSANLSANIVSVMQCGAFLGAIIAHPISNWKGRKPGLLVSAALAGIGGVMQTASSGNIGALYAGRFIEGLGLGMATMITPTYVSENAPRAIRGALIGMYQWLEVLGSFLAFWINYSLVLNESTSNKQWQTSLAIQCLPAVLLFVSMLFFNESPRWLARKDQYEKSAKVLSEIRHLPESHPYVQAELQEMKVQLAEELASVNGGKGFVSILKELWQVKSNRRRAIIAFVLMLCQQMTGTNAINYYAPTIFTNLGVTGNANSLLATGVYGVVRLVSITIFLLFVVDTFGRKKSFVASGLVMFFFMFYIGFYSRFDPPVKGKPVGGAGYFALVSVFLFASAFQLGWGPVCWIYVSETPTNRLRGLNVSIAAATQWLFNLVVARATPVMLVKMGKHGSGTYFFYGAWCLVMAIGAWFLIPETKGVSLERMDELFGGAHLDTVDIGVAAQAADKIDTTHIEMENKV